ncbi:MAG: hypothetical protein HY508_11540 [Acidobacteria bacterium]|nr:hypothetical protein [Acidobacteriota bacterium]
MAKQKKKAGKKVSAAGSDMTPIVAAELAGVIYRAKLENRAAKLNISEAEVVADVIHLWRTVREQLYKA